MPTGGGATPALMPGDTSNSNGTYNYVEPLTAKAGASFAVINPSAFIEPTALKAGLKFVALETIRLASGAMVYNDALALAFGLKSIGAEPGAAYSDIPALKLGLKQVEADAVAVADLNALKAGAKFVLPEVATGADVVGLKSGLSIVENDVDTLAGGHTAYPDAVTLKSGLKLPTLLDGFFANDAGVAKIGLASSLLEIYANRRVTYAYETLRGLIGSEVVLGPETFASVERITFKTGLKALTADTWSTADNGTVKTGAKFTQRDAWNTSDNGTVKTGLKNAVADTLKTIDSGAVKTGLKIVLSEAQQAKESLAAKSGAKFVLIEAMAYADNRSLKAGVKFPAADMMVCADNVGAKTGVKFPAAEAFRASDATAMKIGLKESLAEGRGFFDTAAIKTGAKMGQSDNVQAVDVRTSKFGVAAQGSERTTRALQAGQMQALAILTTPAAGTLVNVSALSDATPENLIEACRILAKATLPELVMIPETLEQSPILASGKLPFMVLVAGDPADVSGNWQVRAVGQQIDIDFVYVSKSPDDGATDGAQALRARLNILQNAFYANYHLNGLVAQLRTASVSANKQNEYEQYFQSNGQPVTVMVLRLSFVQVKAI